MSNRWVIGWLIIDYWRWSMSNRLIIQAQTFCGLSITHRWHRLLIDVIENLLMLLITLILRTKGTSCFLVPFFSFVIFLSVVDVFIFITGVQPSRFGSIINDNKIRGNKIGLHTHCKLDRIKLNKHLLTFHKLFLRHRWSSQLYTQLKQLWKLKL